jgi:hypothetical protein
MAAFTSEFPVSPSRRPPRRGAATVLVADADEATREAAVFALTMAGIRVLQATDVASAQALLHLGVDAALVDARIAAKLHPGGTPLVVMHDEASEGDPATALYKPARSLEMIAALVAADGLGGRPCVLVPGKQQQWASRLSRHGAVVASAASPVAFSHAMTLLRPRFAVAPPELEAQIGAVCTLLEGLS